MNTKDIERKERVEIKETGVEKEEGIVERLRVFYSNFSLSRESEKDERSEEKERELEMSLVAYTSHVCIFGELCAISLDGNLFLLVPCMLKCLTPCVSLENQLVPNVFNCLSFHASFVNHLLPSEAKLDLLCFEHENLHDDYFMEPKVVESCFATSNQLASLSSEQIEFPLDEHEPSNLVESLKTLFGDAHGFQFYHSHFKKFSLKDDLENKMRVGFEKLKASPCAFVKTMLEKESFEQIWKDFVDKHTYYHIPFKDWCWKLGISFVCFQKNSCTSSLSHEIDSSLFYHKPFKELVWKNDISLTLSWKNSCALFLKYEFEATWLYHLHFKEFLKNMIFKEEYRKFWTLESSMSASPLLNLDVVEFEKHKVHSSIINALVFIWNIYFHYHYPFKEEHFQILEFNALLQIFVKVKSFFHHSPYKGLDIGTHFEESTRMFPRHFILNVFTQLFERTLLQNFFFLALASTQNLSFPFHHHFKDDFKDITKVLELQDFHGFNCVVF
ncbi:hypothetical protein M9H77_07724 [Catharanthus roseus]|uniref:Uncharacterized protein n=1 Tax=Catharanthus roseus TaxID=4058 RepID=A0ACC0BVR2_CATRO|nr:hypothetical protein M9H77_07724 [Catharanthus roseus]